MNKTATIKLLNHDFRYYQYEEDEPDESIKTILQDYYWYRDGNKSDGVSKIREPETVRLMRKIVKNGDVCVDIGASIGYFTVLLAGLVGKEGKVYAIEPTKNQCEYLKENIELNGYENRVVIHNIAASDINGEANIRCNNTSPSVQPCKILDDILPEKVDFIKMDIDGSELRALKGLMSTIERNKGLKMVIEYLPQYIWLLNGSVEELDNFLNHYFDKKMGIDSNLYLTRKLCQK